MFAPELLWGIDPETRGGGIGKEAARVREFGVARFQFRHGLAHAFGKFDLEGDEAVPPMAIRVADQSVEGGKIGREFRIAAAGRYALAESKACARDSNGWPISHEKAPGL
jgi:hypothetical protein